MGNMYGGMYGSSDSGRSHKHHKHQHQHHHTAPQRQRQIQQSGSVFLASRRAVAQAQATTMTPGSANPTTPTIEQPVSATHGHHYPSAVATVGEQSSAHTGRAGGGLSTDANQTAGSDKDLAEGTVGEQGEAQHSRPHLSLVERIMNFVRKTWMGLTATEDSELDELEGPTVHYKPEAIETLCQLTKFNRRELQLMYRGFKQECPSGMVKEDTFKMIYSQFFPRGADASQYAHFVFNTFDQDNTGAITFTDFVIGLSVLSRGSLQEKLRWTFNLYDINGDGAAVSSAMQFGLCITIYERTCARLLYSSTGWLYVDCN
ncbi:calsenilin-like isoform X2 [Varroa jacobsoni]|uniref:calsenilin-like isoform X2 n=1 Tax=Varroa jacobsoni TaxID=62625 RepID=UPI000BF2BA86|nr:calsenilin-like isoform X2 [Varroa jacobsoni]